MRISHWSSYVCSSDLHLRRVVVAQQQGEGLRRGHEDAGRPAALALALRLRRVAGASLAGDGEAHPIGSASCWERVCQYVLIPVVAVSRNKQLKRQQTVFVTFHASTIT